MGFPVGLVGGFPMGVVGGVHPGFVPGGLYGSKGVMIGHHRFCVLPAISGQRSTLSGTPSSSLSSSPVTITTICAAAVFPLLSVTISMMVYIQGAS